MQIKPLIIKSVSILAAASIVLSVGACSSYKDRTADAPTYNAQYSYSPELYTQFLDKEIEPVTNVLTSQCMLAQSVIKGTYPIKDAITSAEDSIATIDECIESVTNMIPTEEYKDKRANVIKLMQNAKSSVEAYKAELEKESPDETSIDKAKSLMQSDYIALTNEFNVYMK